MSTPEAIVIGGGITGCATAYELGKRGVKVTLVEREHINSMGSGWTLAGVRQSGRLAPELPIAREAIKRWEHLGEELGAEIDYRQDGNLRLALTPDQVEPMRQVVADGVAHGVNMEYLDAAATREVAPAITDTVVGASFCPTDGHADNKKTVQAYADAARRLGVEILDNTEVLSLMTQGGRVTGVRTNKGEISADVVIVAAGVYTPMLLEPLELHLPINVVLCPVAETVPTESISLKPVLGRAAANFAARQTVSGSIRFIGASVPWNETGQHSKANTGMTVRAMEQLTQNAIGILPGLADVRIERVWGGLIDRTPDALPVFDAVPTHPGLVVGAGLCGHGFGIGPMSGEILANLATEGKDARFDLTAFQLNRFATHNVEMQKLEMLG